MTLSRARSTLDSDLELLVERTLFDHQIHSYVKEVWRSASGTTPPAVQSEYGRPAPYDPQRPTDRDGVVFVFGDDRPDGFPRTWIVAVNDRNQLPVFLEERLITNDDGTVRRVAMEPMGLGDVRRRVKKTKPAK